MRTSSRLLLAALVLLGAFAACSDNDKSESRLIDSLCGARGLCTLEGSARRVQGLTPDSVGFELGPAPGSVVFGLPSDLEPGFTSYAVEVLIQGEGNATSGVLVPNYEWRRIDSDGSTVSRPPSATLTVSQGSHATIADVRLVDLSFYEGACSVSTPGHARHRSR